MLRLFAMFAMFAVFLTTVHLCCSGLCTYVGAQEPQWIETW